MISIHAPRTGSDKKKGFKRCRLDISIHAPRTGSDLATLPFPFSISHFNPRSPHGERRQHYDRTRYHLLFQSTLPARGATAFQAFSCIHAWISIHAPRTGSDAMSWTWSAATPFQSTLPARGATSQLCCRGLWLPHFNPRSPHGERPAARRSGCMCRAISIHAPRTGSDPSPSRGTTISAAFQSTLPARGATPTPGLSDVAKGHFNPRSPHGERQSLSASPCRKSQISIHAPRTGSDCGDSA